MKCRYCNNEANYQNLKDKEIVFCRECLKKSLENTYTPSEIQTLQEQNERMKKQLDEIYYSFDEYKSGGLLPQGLINALSNQQQKWKEISQNGSN